MSLSFGPGVILADPDLSSPIIGTAVGGNGQAVVSFTPPVYQQGLPITQYVITSSPGNITAVGSTSPVTVARLTNGVTYTFTVNAYNVLGPGPASSASNSITPVTVPGAPTIGAASTASATSVNINKYTITK
jgi:hypothetical protein